MAKKILPSILPTADKRDSSRAYYTTPKLNVRFLMFSWERGPLARLRAGRPRSQLRPYCTFPRSHYLFVRRIGLVVLDDFFLIGYLRRFDAFDSLRFTRVGTWADSPYSLGRIFCFSF